MSFDSLQIAFTKPLTIPAPLRAQVTQAPSADEARLLRSVVTTTVAGQISAGLDGLIATSEYLQQVILTICAGSGIQLDPSISPDVMAAIGRIYNTNTPPPGISVEMYASMLDAQISLMQMDIALGNNADREPSPYAVADLITATTAFEDVMIDSLGYKNNLTPRLRALKGDQAIYRNMQEGMATYPAVAGTTSTLPSGLDMSPSVTALFSNFITNQCASYASMFQMLTTPGHIESDIEAITAALLAQVSRSLPVVPSVSALTLPQVLPPVFIASLGASSGSGSNPLSQVNAAMGKVSSAAAQATAMAVQANALKNEIGGIMAGYSTAFSILRSGSNGPSLKGIAHDMTNFMFVRMLSEVSCMCMLLDRAFNLAIAPIKNELGAVSGLLQQVQTLGDLVGHLATGPLKGMVQGGPCTKRPVAKGGAKSPSASKTQNEWDKAFGKGQKGLMSMSAHLDQAMRWINKKFQLLQDSMRKLMNRRSNDSSDYLQVMCSLQALESLIALTVAISSQVNNSVTAITGQPPLQAISGVLSTLSSPTGSSYSIQSGAVVVTPPTVPAVPPSVQSTLNAGGAGLVTSSDLSTVKIGAPSATQKSQDSRG